MTRYFFVLVLAVLTSLLVKGENYLEYHRQIAQAEEAIVNEDFVNAGALYEKVFSSYSFYFARDAYHALQAAVLEKNKKRKYKMLIRTIQAGVKEECLLAAPLIKKYIKELKTNKFKTLYKSHKSRYLAKQNKKLHDEWRQRYHCEQFAKRGKHPSGKSYMECLIENYERLKTELIKTNVYPGERTIGLCDGFYDTLNDQARRRIDSINRERSKNPLNTATYYYSKNTPKECELTNNFVTPTLLHTGISFSELKTYLYKALKNGTLHPRDYMYIYYFESKMGRGQSGYKEYYKKFAPASRDSVYRAFFCQFNRCKDVTKANKWRTKIGVCSVQVDRRKKQITEKYGYDFVN